MSQIKEENKVVLREGVEQKKEEAKETTPGIPATQVIQSTIDYARTTVSKLDSCEKIVGKLNELLVLFMFEARLDLCEQLLRG